MASILKIFTTVFAYPAAWFEAILTASSVSGIFLSMVFVYLMVKFLLRPIFGRSAGSDTVQKKNSEGVK